MRQPQVFVNVRQPAVPGVAHTRSGEQRRALFPWEAESFHRSWNSHQFSSWVPLLFGGKNLKKKHEKTIKQPNKLETLP